MPENESSLLVPLRSNASALVAGGPVDSLRRRLKLASLTFDRIILETGSYRLHTGPTGSSAVYEPFHPREDLRWQSGGQRGAAKGTVFGAAMGREPSPGVPANTMAPIVCRP
jgi:hypothetical protein